MSNLYTPVQSSTFVNVNRGTFYTLRVATHNVPKVVRIWGVVGKAKAFTRATFAQSRQEARELAETTIERLTSNGYVQVA